MQAARRREGDLCFVEGGVERVGGLFSVHNASREAGACVSARQVITGRNTRCLLHTDCEATAGRSAICVHAAPPPPDLLLPLHVVRASAAAAVAAEGVAARGSSGAHASAGAQALVGNEVAEPVLFLGTAQDLHAELELTPYRVRGLDLPDSLAAVRRVMLSVQRLQAPLVLARLLTYIAAISSSIAVFNLVPAAGLDGAFTLQALYDLTLPRGGAVLPGGRGTGGSAANLWIARTVTGSTGLLLASLASSLVRV